MEAVYPSEPVPELGARPTRTNYSQRHLVCVFTPEGSFSVGRRANKLRSSFYAMFDLLFCMFVLLLMNNTNLYKREAVNASKD